MEDRIAQFYAYMKERDAIRQRRAAGQKWPWTDDPILQKYSFTNIKRADDKTSRYLIDAYYTLNADSSPQAVIFNAAVFRYTGTIEFARRVGWNEPTTHGLARVRATAAEMMAAGERVFTGAYMLTNAGCKGPKHEVVCDQFLGDLLRKMPDVVRALLADFRMEEAIGALSKVRGFSTFMSKEVFLDTTYTNVWGPLGPRDKDTWTGVGPGARKGAAYIKLGTLDPLEERAALDVCRAVFAARERCWNGVELELADVQWNFCEFFKVKKVELGLGRPRSLYRPPAEAL